MPIKTTAQRSDSDLDLIPRLEDLQMPSVRKTAEHLDPFEEASDHLSPLPADGPQEGGAPSNWVIPKPVSFHALPNSDPNEEPEVDARPDPSDPRTDSSMYEESTGESKARHINRRLLLAILAGIGIIGVLVLGGTPSRQQARPVSSGDPATSAGNMDNPRGQISSPGDGTLGTPDVRTAAAPPPAPEPSPTEAPSPTPAPSPQKPDDEFAVLLRAGERTDKLSTKLDEIDDQRSITRNLAQPASNEPEHQSTHNQAVPEGTKISLILTEPFRSGIASAVSAEVAEDVLDRNKNVLIPRGSTATIPFLPYEVDRRVINDRNHAVLFETATGQKISLKGVIKGSDGFAGLTGRIKTLGGRSVIHRIGSTAVNTATRVGAREAGNYSPDAETEIYRDSYEFNPSYGFDRSTQVVEVAKDTKCTFTVGA
jgi:type IV secretory pathway VirB10-like protein